MSGKSKSWTQRLLRTQNKIKEIYFFICYFSCIWINNQIERNGNHRIRAQKYYTFGWGAVNRRGETAATRLYACYSKNADRKFFPHFDAGKSDTIGAARPRMYRKYSVCFDSIANAKHHTHTHTTLARTMHRVRHARSCKKAMLFVNRFGWMSALCCQFILCAQFASV